jgi:predicted alpha/beta superfamily hydrolase
VTQLRATLFVLLAACGEPATSDAGMDGDDAGMDRDAGRDVEDPDAGDVEDPDAGAVEDPDAGDPRPLTTIRVHYEGMPGAITLRGGAAPLSWTEDAAAIEESPGVWVFQTRELAAATEWKALLDGDWSRGANYHVAPGDTIDVAPHFVEATGEVTTFTFDTDHIGDPRTVWAYLPAGYDENTRATYPVIYMHDGQNLFDDGEVGAEWRVDETMNAASESGLCPNLTTRCTNDGECGGARCESFHDTIVMGIENGRGARIDELTPSVDEDYGGGDAELYLRALIEDLKPRVDAEYRTREGRESTYIMGSSLGGLISSYAGVRHADVFGRVGAMSPSTWWDDRMLLGEVAAIPSLPQRALVVYVDSGDDGMADTADLADAYEAVGYVEGADFHYVYEPRAMHNEAAWARRLPAAFMFLLGPREEL